MLALLFILTNNQYQHSFGSNVLAKYTPPPKKVNLVSKSSITCSTCCLAAQSTQGSFFPPIQTNTDCSCFVLFCFFLCIHSQASGCCCPVCKQSGGADSPRKKKKNAYPAHTRLCPLRGIRHFFFFKTHICSHIQIDIASYVVVVVCFVFLTLPPSKLGFNVRNNREKKN